MAKHLIKTLPHQQFSGHTKMKFIVHWSVGVKSAHWCVLSLWRIHRFPNFIAPNAFRQIFHETCRSTPAFSFPLHTWSKLFLMFYVKATADQHVYKILPLAIDPRIPSIVEKDTMVGWVSDQTLQMVMLSMLF
jgi:hypothetical protein